MGAKLEHIITQLAREVAQRHVAIPGELVVKPSDHHFWFNKPRLVLILIHIILFQNSFEIAVFFWVLVRYDCFPFPCNTPNSKHHVTGAGLVWLRFLHHGRIRLHNPPAYNRVGYTTLLCISFPLNENINTTMCSCIGCWCSFFAVIVPCHCMPLLLRYVLLSSII